MSRAADADNIAAIESNAVSFVTQIKALGFQPPAATMPASTKVSDCIAALEDTVAKLLAFLKQHGTPPTPTGLAASVISATEIDLTWNASAGATSYTLQSKTLGGTWATIYSGNSTSYHNTGLAAGTRYYYQVNAVAGSKASAYSTTISATTQAGASPVLAASVLHFNFTAIVGQGNPLPQGDTFTNTGGGTLTISSITNSHANATVTPSSGTAPLVVQNGWNVGTLTAGTYTDTQTVASNGGTLTIGSTLVLSPAPSGSLTLLVNGSPPTNGQTITGIITLATSQAVPSGAVLEYVVNGVGISAGLAGNGPWSWNTIPKPNAGYGKNGCPYDGSITIQALAISTTDGSIVASSAVASLNISNTAPVSNRTITISSPLDNAAVAGSFNWSSTITLTPSAAFAAYLAGSSNHAPLNQMPYFIDGTIYANNFSVSTVTLSIDSTKLLDGSHELAVGSQLNWAAAGYPQIIGKTIDITTNNGTAFNSHQFKYPKQWVHIGDTIDLSMLDVLCNRTTSTSGNTFTYASSNTAVISNAGVALTAGAATITATGNDGKTCTAYIVSDLVGRGFPHYTKSGTINTVYDAATSLVTVSCFSSGGGGSTPTILIGANQTLYEVGVFLYLPNLYSTYTLAQVKAAIDSAIHLAISNSGGMLISATGDNLFSSFSGGSGATGFYNWISNDPNAETIITYWVNAMAATGKIVCVHMKDETDSPFGSTPNTQMQTLIGWITAANPNLIIPWPTLGSGALADITHWQNPPSSKSTELYWAPGQQPTYAEAPTSLRSPGGNFIDMQARMQVALPYAYRAGPLVIEGVLCPSSDIGFTIHNLDDNAVVTGVCALIYGAAFPRFYNTSADMQSIHIKGWKELTNLSGLLVANAAQVLQQEYKAVYVPGIETGARAGANGAVLFTVNAKPVIQPATVDLSVYTGFGSTITRYVISGSTMTTSTITGSSDTLTYGPYDAAIYVVK